MKIVLLKKSSVALIVPEVYNVKPLILPLEVTFALIFSFYMVTVTASSSTAYKKPTSVFC